MAEHFNSIAKRYIKRRSFLKSALPLALASTTPYSVFGKSHSDKNTPETPLFSPLPHQSSQTHLITKGYTASTLIRWGDSLGGEDPASWPLSSDYQRKAFGSNNDFIAYMPLSTTENASGSDHVNSNNSEHGLLCINNEYTLPQLMFPGFESRKQAEAKMNSEQILSEMMACGISIIEIKRNGKDWVIEANSRYQRRIHTETAIDIVGPVRGNQRLKTKADPKAISVRGTLGNCAGGKTPWGTVLSAEENFQDFFGGDPRKMPVDARREVANHLNFDIFEIGGHWSRVDERFNVELEPNEMNRFGWVIEYNPYDPNSVPKKLTALGRFKHEGATLVCKPGQPVVAYSGDDDENQHLFRFVSTEKYVPGDDQANQDLLHEGTLYCARFNDDGSGDWLPLTFGQGPLTPVNGFENQADVLIDARRAANLLGATPMDRPEDVETSPTTDRTYMALTNNRDKHSPNSANPKFWNPSGHILEMIPPGVDGNRDHLNDRFQWQLYLVAGNPEAEANLKGAYGGPIEPWGWFANPDNIAFDKRNRLWIATDGCNKFGFNDGLWCAATTGDNKARPKHFFSCPVGAELCGPEFTPDGKSLFVAVQHPAEGWDSHYGKPSTRWPDFKPGVPPRSAIMVITKNNGGLIGD